MKFSRAELLNAGSHKWKESEVWKDISGYVGLYQVSNFGRVKSLQRVIKVKHPTGCTYTKRWLCRILKPVKDTNGYSVVSLGKHNRKLIHRLVAEAFIPNPENKPHINHIDGNKTNNFLENLEWATVSENALHSHRVLRHKSVNPTLGKFGKNHHNSKIVLQIKDGKIIAKFYGAAEAERKTKINRTAICMTCRGYHKTAGGFQWKYKE